MTFCFFQFFKHQVSNKKPTHQKESINAYKSIVYGLKFKSFVHLKKKRNENLWIKKIKSTVGTKNLKSRSFHQYSWNSEVETTWISLIRWPHGTRRLVFSLSPIQWNGNLKLTWVKKARLVIGKKLISALRICPSITHDIEINLKPSKHAKWSPLGGLVLSSRFVFAYSPKFNKNFWTSEMNSIKSCMQTKSNKDKSLRIVKSPVVYTVGL